MTDRITNQQIQTNSSTATTNHTACTRAGSRKTPRKHASFRHRMRNPLESNRLRVTHQLLRLRQQNTRASSKGGEAEGWIVPAAPVAGLTGFAGAPAAGDACADSRARGRHARGSRGRVVPASPELSVSGSAAARAAGDASSDLRAMGGSRAAAREGCPGCAGDRFDRLCRRSRVQRTLTEAAAQCATASPSSSGAARPAAAPPSSAAPAADQSSCP